MSRSRHWLVAGVFAILTFGIPLLYVNAQPPDHPVIRLVQTGQQFTGLFIEEDARLLVVTSTDRRATRAAIGTVSRPWEPDAVTVIAPADDRVFPSLWDASRHPAVEHVLVVGLPGAEADWSRLEDDLRSRDVQLTFISEPSRVSTRRSDVEVYPSDGDSGAHIRFQRGDAVATMMLDSGDAPAGQHALIGYSLTGPTDVELMILPGSTSAVPAIRTVLVQRNEVVTIVLEETRLRVQGGQLVWDGSPAN